MNAPNIRIRGKITRFLIAGDSHGDMIDPVAEKAVLAFAKDFKPELRIHLGDGLDLRNLRKGASDDEKAGSLQDDWEMGSDFLRRYFDGGKNNHYLGGNHCYARLYSFTKSANGVLRDFANDAFTRFRQLIETRCRATLYPYDARLGILRIGHIKAVHGYFHGKSAPMRHAAVYGHCMHGHTHAATTAPVEADRGPEEAVGMGCLCKVDMDYNMAQTNKLTHVNAFGYGYLYADGTYTLFRALRVKDNFVAAHQIKVY